MGNVRRRTFFLNLCPTYRKSAADDVESILAKFWEIYINGSFKIKWSWNRWQMEKLLIMSNFSIIFRNIFICFPNRDASGLHLQKMTLENIVAIWWANSPLSTIVSLVTIFNYNTSICREIIKCFAKNFSNSSSAKKN